MSNVVLYHTDSCGQCNMAVILLNREKIDFTSCKDVNIMKDRGIHKTPTLEVNGQLFEGVKAINEWIKNRE